MNLFLKRALIATLLLPFFYSCGSYQTKMQGYSRHLQQGNYDQAIKSIQKNKLLRKKRNTLLLNMELGRLYMLHNEPEKSNAKLNEADKILESNYKSVKDVAVSNLVNPMMQTYRGEEFEKLMVHYFKALNYIKLDKVESAIVEARRITLASQRLSDKYKSNTSRYNQDPFILNFQGLLYELNGDWNNAFISYRNAADIYLNAKSTYYGVAIPGQLKQDLLYSAYMMGFTDLQTRYEGLFNEKLTRQNNETGELVLLIETGMAPVKEEYNIMANSIDGLGTYRYMDPMGSYVTIPFDYRLHGIPQYKMNDFRTVEISIPRYRVVYPALFQSAITLNGKSYPVEICQNFNLLSLGVMSERYLIEIANALARFLVKKTMEKASESIARNIAENNSKDKKDDSATAAQKEKERKEKAENIGKTIGFLVNIANTITEKPDTRSWMSLPAYIHYVRLPLQAGTNNISFSHAGRDYNLTVNARAGLQIHNIKTN